MAKVKKYRLHLSDEDEVIVVMEIERGVLVGFSVAYGILDQGEPHQVARYDTAHGAVHLHRFSRTGPGRTLTRPPAIPSGLPLADAFDAAILDVKGNWRKYRALWEATC